MGEANLCLGTGFGAYGGDGDPIHGMGDEAVAEKAFAGTDANRVLAVVERGDIPGFRFSADSDVATLADGIAGKSAVGSQFFAVGADEFAGLFIVIFEQEGVVGFIDKILAFRFVQ